MGKATMIRRALKSASALDRYWRGYGDGAVIGASGSVGFRGGKAVGKGVVKAGEAMTRISADAARRSAAREGAAGERAAQKYMNKLSRTNNAAPVSASKPGKIDDTARDQIEDAWNRGIGVDRIAQSLGLKRQDVLRHVHMSGLAAKRGK